jgi:EmrB/QacA subfamily drug resistance transporter
VNVVHTKIAILRKSIAMKKVTAAPGGGASLEKPGNLTMILVLYLLGIFMGAIDTGIVTPARTLIQSALGVDERTGIWMITIYTLAYAAIIPISGKLADRFGRKVIYLVSIGLFGLGSLICSLSASSGQFWVLLAGRVVQAIGGGGIMPIATAEFGTTFPAEKRGMALGLVGGVYGIANILGSTIGSSILGIFGTARWNLIFLVNVPIALAIVAAGFFFLPNNKGESKTKIDWAGIPVLSAMVLLLLYGLRNLDFFNLLASLGRTNVYPFLLGFLALLPVLILIERRSADPVLNLSYFTSRPTLITLILGFAVGIMMMGMVFVPQFAENALSIASGSGGYFVAMLGLFAGISAPLSGRLIDRFGPKKVLFSGFGITLAGALFLILVTIPQSSTFTVLASLGIIGLGLGFTMGTPLNYMMLQNTRPEESNSALATLSLVRSIGTAIAPAIMIGFLAHAGMSAQTNLMALLPPVESPRLENTVKLQAQLEALRKDPQAAAMLSKMSIPSFDMGSTMKLDIGSGSLPPEIAARLRSADVTTIVDDLKVLSSTMFELKTPSVIEKITGGLGQGLIGIDQALASMDKSAAGLSGGMKGLDSALMGMDLGLAGIDAALARAKAPPQIDALKAQRAAMAQSRDELAAKKAGMVAGAAGIAAGRARLAELRSTLADLQGEVAPAFAASKNDYLAKLEAMRPQIEETFRSSLNSGFRQMYVTVAAASVVAGIVLAFYRSARRKDEAGASSVPAAGNA